MIPMGRICAYYRHEIGYTMREIASDTGYTIANISHFEHGRNDNATILLWYVMHGLTQEKYLLINDILKGGN